MSKLHSTLLTATEKQAAHNILNNILARGVATNGAQLEKIKNIGTREHNLTTISHTQLLAVYEELTFTGELPETEWLRRKLRKRSIRTLSGIAPISVLTKPFPCPGKCVYCPTERAPADGKTLFEIDSEKKYGKLKIAKKYKVPGALVMPKSY